MNAMNNSNSGPKKELLRKKPCSEWPTPINTIDYNVFFIFPKYN